MMRRLIGILLACLIAALPASAQNVQPSGSPSVIAGQTLAQAQTTFEQSFVTTAATGVNFNSVADTALAFTMPSGFTRILLFSLTITNASHSLTTATFGVFTATAAGGQALIASGTAITISATADQTANNAQNTNGVPTLSAVSASLATPNTIYFRVTNGEGATATGDVTAVIRVLP